MFSNMGAHGLRWWGRKVGLLIIRYIAPKPKSHKVRISSFVSWTQFLVLSYCDKKSIFQILCKLCLNIVFSFFTPLNLHILYLLLVLNFCPIVTLQWFIWNPILPGQGALSHTVTFCCFLDIVRRCIHN